jgi:hypothetical protein
MRSEGVETARGARTEKGSSWVGGRPLKPSVVLALLVPAPDDGVCRLRRSFRDDGLLAKGTDVVVPLTGEPVRTVPLCWVPFDLLLTPILAGECGESVVKSSKSGWDGCRS